MSIATNPGIVSQRKCFNKSLYISCFNCSFDFYKIWYLIANPDVTSNSIRENKTLLHYNATPFAPLLLTVTVERDTSQHYFPFNRFVKPKYQLNKCAFPTSACTNNFSNFICRNLQINIFQHFWRIWAFVLKSNVF